MQLGIHILRFGAHENNQDGKMGNVALALVVIIESCDCAAAKDGKTGNVKADTGTGRPASS